MQDYKDLNDYELIYMINEKNEEASNMLFDKYRPVINKLARKYYHVGKNYGLELDDFIQEGNYALFYAIKKYSDKKDSVFYTYVNLCIKSKMYNLIVNGSTNKNMALNDSISLYEEIKEDTDLIDLLEDKKVLLPDIALDVDIMNDKIKDFLYDLSFEHSMVFELKMNGFSVHDISILLDKNRANVSRIMTIIRKNLRLYVEKLNT